MSIFKKKHTKEPDEKLIALSDKIIKALNYTPPEYTHSPEFIKTPEEALSEARSEVAKLQVIDAYIDDFRDSFIDSDTRHEIDEGKRQYNYHIGSILHITEQAMDDKIKSECIKNMLERAIEENEKDLSYYSLLEAN